MSIAAQIFPVWSSDELGEGFRQSAIPLGDDPDGEGEIFATLVKHVPPVSSTAPRGAVVHLHGYNDYFFQRGLAEHISARGLRFYALDLRKSGRSRREWLTPHYSSDFTQYDADLEAALEAIRADFGGGKDGPPTVVVGHSTGGLIAPLSIARLRRDLASGTARMVRGLVLNSPFAELPAPAALRMAATGMAETAGRLAPRIPLPHGSLGVYGESLHKDYRGEWEYSLERKPLVGPPYRLGWVRAVTRAQRQLRRGCAVGVPALVLHSDRSYVTGSDPEQVDAADSVLDVAHIKRAVGFLTPEATAVEVPGARHDVFLSRSEARARAYAALDTWLDAHEQMFA